MPWYWTCRDYVNYINICEDNIQQNKTKLYKYLFKNDTLLNKLWKTNNTKGMTIKPEKDIALVIVLIWYATPLFSRRIWKANKVTSDMTITNKIFAIKFLKLVLSIEIFLMNSTGMNKTNIAENITMKNQNSVSPDQVVKE